MTEFKAAAIDKCFQNGLLRFRQLIAQNSDRLSVIGEKFEHEIDDFLKRGFLTIAFIGEYSSGKSTVISALTNRRDIKISADIATDATTAYDWNSIRIIDTPGLFTERKDHDEITYDAIRQADLLVFCLTHALFDSITVENFKKLAYVDRYHSKMMLLINKMSSEAGDDETKIKNYKKSIETALKGFSINNLSLCYVDARDYLEGIDEDDNDLVSESRFLSFIDVLNDFVKVKGALARLDTPIRIAINHLRDASSALSRTTQEDNVYLELLNRLSKSVDRERARLRNKIFGIAAELSAKVNQIGIDISQFTGSPDELNAESKSVESKICGLTEAACERLDNAVQQAQTSLQEAIKDILNSELSLQFLARLEVGTLTPKGINVNDSSKRLEGQIESLSSIGGKVGVGIAKKAAGAKYVDGFISSTGASGSVLHKGILSTGKLLGYSFKPWQAVNLAKTIGNVAKVLGPVLSILAVVVDVVSVFKEEETERKLSVARRSIIDDFSKMANDLENQFMMQLREVENELYDRVEADISVARKDEEMMISASNQKVALAVEIRNELESLLKEIEHQFRSQD